MGGELVGQDAQRGDGTTAAVDFESDLLIGAAWVMFNAAPSTNCRGGARQASAVQYSALRAYGTLEIVTFNWAPARRGRA